MGDLVPAGELAPRAVSMSLTRLGSRIAARRCPRCLPVISAIGERRRQPRPFATSSPPICRYFDGRARPFREHLSGRCRSAEWPSSAHCSDSPGPNDGCPGASWPSSQLRQRHEGRRAGREYRSRERPRRSTSARARRDLADIPLRIEAADRAPRHCRAAAGAVRPAAQRAGRRELEIGASLQAPGFVVSQVPMEDIELPARPECRPAA